MEGKEEKKMMVPFPSPSSSTTSLSLSETQLTNAVNTHDSDSFYTKLTQLLKSTGLTLIFNVRNTLLDLYQLYLEVTKRGGYHQVSKERKWSEVASALKLEGSNANILSLSDQLASLYCYLLCPYEKLYFYRSPPKLAKTSTTKGLHKRKSNPVASLSPLMVNEDNQLLTNISADCSIKMAGSNCVEKPLLLQAPSNDKKKRKRVGAPSGQKNAYHIFLKQECARLKTCRQDLDGRRILPVAVDTWSNMSESEKRPYVEESKKCKEKQQSMEERRKWEEKRPSVCGDYCVTSQPEVYESVVNKAAMVIDLEITEKASKDSNSYGSLDLPPGREYK